MRIYDPETDGPVQMHAACETQHDLLTEQCPNYDWQSLIDRLGDLSKRYVFNDKAIADHRRVMKLTCNWLLPHWILPGENYECPPECPTRFEPKHRCNVCMAPYDSLILLDRHRKIFRHDINGPNYWER